jgi:hypothetical protein
MRAFYLNFPIRQTLSAESIDKGKSQIPLGKSKTVSRKFTIPQTVSAKFQKSQTVSGKFEPMLSWSHYCELLKVEESLARAEAGGSIKDVVESEKEQLNHPSAIR